jgi:hypothetical protein
VTGMVVAMFVIARMSPPAWIENWQDGAVGEQWTGRACASWNPRVGENSPRWWGETSARLCMATFSHGGSGTNRRASPHVVWNRSLGQLVAPWPALTSPGCDRGQFVASANGHPFG